MKKLKVLLEELGRLHPKYIDLSLLRINKLLKKLGNPHLQLPPCIHIAGTNGKGSTLSFIKSIMLESNYKVHAYISPHLEKIKARALMSKIIEAQIESGQPYMLYKDSINKKSNQKNIGIIKSSNLCAEIVEYSDKNETAVCNLASIALPKFVNKKEKKYNYKKLYETAKLATKNLDKVIDINFYPTDKTKKSNNLHRPIGLGVQGLSDVFFILTKISFGNSSSGKSILASICDKIFKSFSLHKLNLSDDAPLMILIACFLCSSVSAEIKSAILSAFNKFIFPF